MRKKNNLIDWCKENEKEYLLEEWDVLRNREELGLEIEDVTYGSKKKVWWGCIKGHFWQAEIGNRTNGQNCPICQNKEVLKGYNDLATTHPELLEEWNYEKNDKLGKKPTNLSYGSGSKVHWICKNNPKHKWETTVNSRTSMGTRCPYCSEKTSFPEQYLYYILKSKFKEVSNREIIEGYEYDIHIIDINLLIEYDGYYYHRVLTNGKEREIEKEEKAKELGFDFIRVKEAKIDLENIKIKNNIIRYKYKNNTVDLDVISGLIIDYINSKYSLGISKDIPKESEKETRLLMAKEKYENSIESTHPKLLKEWHYVKNGNLKPSMCSKGSHTEVWWICNKKHEYKAVINNKVKGSGCPVCDNKKIIKGHNDFQTYCKDNNMEHLLEEWDYKKNENLKPYMYAKGSSKKIWWLCKEGHGYQTPIIHRVNGVNCPFCSGKYPVVGKTDLKTTNPEILKEWDYDKNTNISPEDVSAGSSKRVWWKCCKMHSWDTTVANRVYGGSKCPYCSGRKAGYGNSLGDKNQKLSKEWHQEKNGELTPFDVTPGSGKKVWWVCEDKHEWMAVINSRNFGNSCPICREEKRNKKEK